MHIFDSEETFYKSFIYLCNFFIFLCYINVKLGKVIYIHDKVGLGYITSLSLYMLINVKLSKVTHIYDKIN